MNVRSRPAETASTCCVTDKDAKATSVFASASARSPLNSRNSSAHCCSLAPEFHSWLNTCCLGLSSDWSRNAIAANCVDISLRCAPRSLINRSFLPYSTSQEKKILCYTGFTSINMSYNSNISYAFHLFILRDTKDIKPYDPTTKL